MDQYIEIRLLPDPEFSPTVLMNALFGKLHQALVELHSNAIGLSFPDMQEIPPALGSCLRVHGSRERLQKLMSLDSLTGMSDYIAIGDLNPTPPNIEYRTIRRVQAKSNPERLRRRLRKRKGISEEEARRYIPDSAQERLKLPFVTIYSQSTGHKFRLFIEHQPITSEPADGEFSSYGLSPTASVPWF